MPPTSAERKQQVVADFRRSEILAAATKVFANKGFDATRMEEIAKGAKLAKGTLYRYFDSKDAVHACHSDRGACEQGAELCWQTGRVCLDSHRFLE